MRIRLMYFAVVSAFVFIIMFSLTANGVPVQEWLYLLVPIFMGYFSFVTLNVRTQKIRKKTALIIAAILLISAFLPLGTAFLSQEIILNKAANTDSVVQKVQVIGELTRNNLATYGIFRSSNDYWKYLLVGTGACYEAAMASSTLLKEAGFETQIIGFPGEDHAFTEVKINGEWMVIDPGYGYVSPISRQERANARLNEMGAISYVIAYTASNFTELTSQYVPTDTVTIKVMNDGKPMPNAQVYLTHEFMNKTTRIPEASMSFITNATGEITMHLGALTYNEKADPCEHYYWVYVNGQRTDYNVTSSGNNISESILIDMNRFMSK